MSSLLLLFLANIPANLLLVYVFSFGFSKYETCQAVLPGVFIFVSYQITRENETCSAVFSSS